MKTIQTDFYGDSFRWFVGVVVSNHDPLKLGRVKVRVRGLHSNLEEDIPTADLPWAQVVVPSTEGGISGIGKMPQLQNGSQVVGFFADGEASQLPIIMGLYIISKKGPMRIVRREPREIYKETKLLLHGDRILGRMHQDSRKNPTHII